MRTRRLAVVLWLAAATTLLGGCGRPTAERPSDAAAGPGAAGPESDGRPAQPQERTALVADTPGPTARDPETGPSGDVRTKGDVTSATIYWIPAWPPTEGTYAAGFAGTSRKGGFAEAVDVLAGLPKLRLLFVDPHDDGLTAEQYREIARLESLEEIVIDTHASVRGPELAPLAAMPNLKSLEFQEGWVHAAAVQALAPSDSLEQFRVGAGDDLEAEAERLKARFRIIYHGNYAP